MTRTEYGNGHERDDSLTPSNSASQARDDDDESDDGSLEPPVPKIERQHSPSPPPQPNGHGRSLSPPPRALSPAPRASRPVPAPRPILTVPSAPRPISSYPTPSETPSQPTFVIPKAPPLVMAASRADSSDDESIYPPEHAVQRAPPRLRRRAMSDTSSLHGTTARRSSFFGGIAALFKRRSPSVAAEDQRASWEPTRTDRTAERGSRVRGSSNLREDDTSDDEGMPKNVVRVVNDPRKRAKAVSDVGKSAPAGPTGGKLERKGKPAPRKASSDVGVLSSILPEQPRRRRPSTVVAPPAPAPAPAPTLSRQPLSRSSTVRTTNTVASARTATTNGTVKKRKKKVVAAPTPIPTAADLSASLPSAIRASFYETPSLPPSPSLPASPTLSEPASKEPRHRAPKSLAANAARAKRESALLGSADWIAHPSPPAHHPPAHHAPARQVTETDLSLDAQVSRSYAPGQTLGADLHKRKSVRLADVPDSEPERTASPPSSVRSDAREAPTKGILVHHSPSPSAVLVASGVDTAWSRRREGDDESSEEEDGEYAAVKKRLVRETRKLEGAYSGKDKGKGREQLQ